jgi:hypothetical protein
VGEIATSGTFASLNISLSFVALVWVLTLLINTVHEFWLGLTCLVASWPFQLTLLTHRLLSMFGFASRHYTSGVEAVSCPPSGGVDMLSSSSSGVLAFGPPTHATSGALP